MFTVEICAATLSSALAAQAAGAHRIELCSGLEVGGLTPSLGLLQAVRACVRLPVYVLIRPREGHFCYTEGELSVMLRDIAICREAGADGVVVGALDAQGQLHERHLRAMAKAAQGIGLGFHRALDGVVRPEEALERLIDLGFERVLTSGRAPTAVEGIPTLRRWIEQVGGRIAVMPGAGVTAANIKAIAEGTGAVEFHLSAKRRAAIYGTAAVPLPGLEPDFWESDANIIRQVLGQLGGQAGD
jgi:copper homeostasis protein